ncbi:MAG: DUF255 domain-containing protein [Capsulimonadaceae bacterium]|nr:DUF255 domain-containing protein [Capsulimonadaceae bacterium]
MSLIDWRDWSENALCAAHELDRPILLDIGAVWCHWCHVMDDGIPGDPIHTGTYSNSEVARLISDRFVAIRVDTDRRPDINARYNMGGWPTTVFLTPDGEPIHGETYVAPHRMLGLLTSIADYYRDHKSEIGSAIAQKNVEAAPCDPGTESLALPVDASDHVVAAVFEAYDELYGGFGMQPKFPHVSVLRFALARAVVDRDAAMERVLVTTLKQMASGGMYDRYAGGFFRYSTTRDWSVPHFEKMLEDNAQLSGLCIQSGVLLGDEELIRIGEDVHRWLFSLMYNQDSGCFAGSQDADREFEYYGLPLSERAKLPTPYIDRTIYADWNARMVSSLVTRYRASGDRSFLDLASRAFRYIVDRILPGHYVADSVVGGPANLLGDLYTCINASMDLAGAMNDGAYLMFAGQFGETILDTLVHPSGAFQDVNTSGDAKGLMARPNVDQMQSAEAALALLRLGNALGDERYRRAAERALLAQKQDYQRLGIFGASYARAVRAALMPRIRVVVTGAEDDDRLLEFERVAGLSPVDTICSRAAADDVNEYPADPTGAPQAYVCIGSRCLAPVTSPADLLRTLSEIRPVDAKLHNAPHSQV